MTLAVEWTTSLPPPKKKRLSFVLTVSICVLFALIQIKSQYKRYSSLNTPPVVLYLCVCLSPLQCR